MNRRSFFRSIAKGVLATAAGLYAPRLLEAEPERDLIALVGEALERVRQAHGVPVFYATIGDRELTFRGIPIRCENPLG